VILGIQHSLEFFKELIFDTDDLSFEISTVLPINKGANTEVIGIRQYEMDDIPKANNITPIDGNAPNIAFPAFVVLQLTYCSIIFTAEIITKLSNGNPNHNINLNDDNVSLNWNNSIVTIRNSIAIGIPEVRESTVETFISGIDIPN
jgi:hypothetical protein